MTRSRMMDKKPSSRPKRIRSPEQTRKALRRHSRLKDTTRFRRRYSRLFRSLTQEDTKVVVSLGGGGIRMFAHTAVLRFLERLGVQRNIAEIWGASGGSIIACYYAMGLSPDEINASSQKLLKQRKTVKISPAPLTVIKNLILETFLAKSSEENLKGFMDIQKSMRELIGTDIQKGHLRIPFYCLAYNLAKNQTDVLTPLPIPDDLYPDFIYQTDSLDAIIASSSIPILFVPKVITDDYGRRVYVDGSTGEEIPTVSVYKKWLRDKELGLEKRKRLLVISVDLQPSLSSLGILENWLIQKIPAFQYLLMAINFTDLMRKARIEDQKRVLTSDPNVEVWALTFQLKGAGVLNVKMIPKVIEKSEHSFPIQLAKINESLLD